MLRPLEVSLQVGHPGRADSPSRPPPRCRRPPFPSDHNGERKHDDVPDLNNTVRVDYSIFGTTYTV